MENTKCRIENEKRNGLVGQSALKFVFYINKYQKNGHCPPLPPHHCALNIRNMCVYVRMLFSAKRNK